MRCFHDDPDKKRLVELAWDEKPKSPMFIQDQQIISMLLERLHQRRHSEIKLRASIDIPRTEDALHSA